MEYIDMHSHILPGMDDGSKNMDMTLAMLRVAVEEGIGTIYTTPHCMPGKGHPTLAKVEERIRLVQEAAEAEGIQITLKKGTEYYYIEEMSEWMEEGKIITLGASNCVLVEFEPYAEEKYIRNAVREILGFGYQPVIAHVERYQQKVGTLARIVVKETDVLLAGLGGMDGNGEVDGGMSAEARQLMEDANQRIADMLQRETDELLDKVLFDASMKMRNAFSRDDA